MATLRIQLLGKLQMRWDHTTILGLEVRKVQEFFCYLLIHRQQAHSREALASLLWSECSTAQSKTYLRKALWQLQTALSLAHGEGRPPILLAGPERIQLNPQADLWLDVAVLESAFAAVRHRPGMGLDGEEVTALR